ncbi:phosphoribosylglycinamide formyltransferase [Candidatus Dependentiae bacterium]|nr:MAG: phosphoribosylglycinamide formyltransferase [Candidatus Dependentiae bacterium]
MNIAIFCSGNGSNFQALVNSVKKGEINAHIALMVCDNPDAYALKRAENEEIKSLLVQTKAKSKDEYEEEIIKNLGQEKIGLICLAGYMRLLSPQFVQKYRNKILNIHPALLPAFKGRYAIKDALDYGVKVSGVTVHFVDEKIDNGPIVLQEEVQVYDNDSEEALAARIHQIEHQLYPRAIKLFVDGKLKVEGRKVKIEPEFNPVQQFNGIAGYSSFPCKGYFFSVS